MAAMGQRAIPSRARSQQPDAHAPGSILVTPLTRKSSMRDHRIAVGVSLEKKIREHRFFLAQIIATSRGIEQKHIKQDYPINMEVDRLNYFFSAYLNTVQSLKDASANVAGKALSWRELSP